MTAKPHYNPAWDLLKCLGLALMFADHAGAFFFPDNLWLRAIGRGTMPVFLFLTGYAPLFRQSRQMLLLGVGLSALAIAMRGHWYCLNILLTISLCRYLLEWTEKKKLNPWSLFLFLNIIALPTMLLFEYGSYALMIAYIGYMQRRPEQFPPRSRLLYGMAALACYGALSGMLFKMEAEFSVLALTLGGVGALFWCFPEIFSKMATARPTPLLSALRWPGRYTLYIYAAHLAALMIYNPQAL